MTEAIKQKLHAFHNEEDADSHKYCDFANELEAEGMHHEAGIFRDIAEEEQTHRFLMGVMLNKEAWK